jgi:hypothetical protein
MHRSTGMGITAMEFASNPNTAFRDIPTTSCYWVRSVPGGVSALSSLFPGDVISVNPGELHDGHPIGGNMRRWRNTHFEPKMLEQQFTPDEACKTEFVSPSLRDPQLGGCVNLPFDRLKNGADRLGVEEIVAHVVRRLDIVSTYRTCHESASTHRGRSTESDHAVGASGSIGHEPLLDFARIRAQVRHNTLSIRHPAARVPLSALAHEWCNIG